MKLSLEDINEWNMTKRWPKAFLDSDGDTNIELVVNLDGGVSFRNLEDTLDWWSTGMSSFVTYARERKGN